jgi:hypothetical protein
LVIKNRASPKRNNIILSLYSNTTVWELKRTVAKHLELIPKYLRLERQNGKAIRDLDNGKTLGELGIQNNEVIVATKMHVEEEVPNAPLIGPDGKLSTRAKEIFNEWYDMYSDENG